MGECHTWICYRNSNMVMSVLHDLNLQGKTVIVVTHDEEIVSRADNRVFL